MLPLLVLVLCYCFKSGTAIALPDRTLIKMLSVFLLVLTGKREQGKNLLIAFLNNLTSSVIVRTIKICY
jgi:hypothetical protein